LKMLDSAADHFIHNLMPSASDYTAAENELSRAQAADANPTTWEPAAREAKRKAANLAIAIDGLTDRCTVELGCSTHDIRSSVAKLCIWPGTEFLRPGCIERVRAVADAYKHGNLTNPAHPISSDRDVLIVGLGYGLEDYGAGKYGGALEVIVRDKSGRQWKFLADAPVAVAAWLRFLRANGAILPTGPYNVCGLQLC
jgi:hypothetical protein